MLKLTEAKFTFPYVLHLIRYCYEVIVGHGAKDRKKPILCPKYLSTGVCDDDRCGIL